MHKTLSQIQQFTDLQDIQHYLRCIFYNQTNIAIATRLQYFYYTVRKNVT